jgi:Domain of unknown function (DUF4032)
VSTIANGVTEPYALVLRAEWPGLIGLDWARPLGQWRDRRLVELPMGLSRHTVRFIEVSGQLFALKELPGRPARHEYDALRRLEELGASAVRPVGIVTRAGDPTADTGAVLITSYAEYSFSYRELISGEGFGPRRPQLLDAFAFLLVELHMLGCFWGDCSLSNTLYRYDAGAIEPIMVDAETAEIHPQLSDGQRRYDIDIMVENVAAEMMDIAASKGADIDDADYTLGEDISRRYTSLWNELAAEQRLPADSAQYRINERIRRLNDLGFEVEEFKVVPAPGGGDGDGRQIQLQLKVADRSYHANRLRELTGVEASENQARQILSDLSYHQMRHGGGASVTGKALSAARWRVEEFEPWLRRLSEHLPEGHDPVQAYTDVLHHRYMLSLAAGHDVGTEAAFQRWLQEGQPGYPLPAS